MRGDEEQKAAGNEKKMQHRKSYSGGGKGLLYDIMN